MKAKGYFRQNCLANYDYPMPFAVRSIGCTTMKAGEADIISGALRHPSLEISWTISGCGEIIHYGQPFEMRRNDVFLFLPDETHHYRVKSREWHWRWLCLDGPLAAAMLLACRLPRKISCDSGFPEALFRRIEENISTDSPGMLAELSGTAWQIIARLIGSHHPGFHKDIYEECMDYIRNRYQEPELGIDFLAEHVGVSRSTLTRLFRERRNEPVSACIRNVRMMNAVALLSGTDWPIAEIARRCGYPNPVSFTRLFTRREHCSPGEYRRRQRSGGTSE
ncbi:AraC family transcriptional regulator [uncultured Victivallis sp.]|uniref:AraC family transcriptional regulator n=1 Tax=uncultured Victivallis sp. TaxID=354118 RepID=UPI0025FCC581|nr:AraC family transcriptional regulator [uncultured Victivallis sp.]